MLGQYVQTRLWRPACPTSCIHAVVCFFSCICLALTSSMTFLYNLEHEVHNRREEKICCMSNRSRLSTTTIYGFSMSRVIAGPVSRSEEHTSELQSREN